MSTFTRLRVSVFAVAVATLSAFLAYYGDTLIYGEDHSRQTSIASLWTDDSPDELSNVCAALHAALPSSVWTRTKANFLENLGAYWSQQAQDVLPNCVVKPRNVDEVSAAVKVLHKSFQDQNFQGRTQETRFAVRGGGYSPEASFASIDNGPLIDAALLNEVLIASDRSTVSIGAGCIWRDVSAKLDTEDLAVVGGRNTHVGVGGLSLGGGVSFLSPRFGFICSNIPEYEIVLANGTITTASESFNNDLWRALKGGSGNFGIVTRFTARTFPSQRIWGGTSYSLARKAPQYLDAFHNFLATNDDEFAAPPILAIGYTYRLGFKLIPSWTVYTRPRKWPEVLQTFHNIGRLWSTHHIRTLTSMMDELHRAAPSGARQFQITTTIHNDLETMQKAHDIFDSTIQVIRHIKRITHALIYQPLSLASISKGEPNVLGLETRNASRVLILLTMAWKHRADDAFVEREARSAIADLERFAVAKGTHDPYRYLNYAASGQDVFLGYGKENKLFLQQTSQKYDPDGFWQRAKSGGFKLFD